ncbi:MAG: EamA family transporter [Marmoricola sp.]
MAAVLLALAGAVAYGLSDFLGGLTARRTSAWPVAFLACSGALLGSLLLAVLRGGDPHGANFAWAALAGVGSGVGSGFLYRGLAGGRMGVVAPVSAVGAAVLPVVVGVAGGERPGAWVWVGILVALPAIWLVSREEDAGVDAGADAGHPSAAGSGLLDGVLAGLGFGLLFAALGQVPGSAGYWPLAVAQVASMVGLVAVATGLRQSWVPRDRRSWWGLVPGLLATVAVLCFLLATDRGLLTVSAVLTSLYPAATVLLAVVVLHERIHRPQAIGLGLCAAAVVCVALG